MGYSVKDRARMWLVGITIGALATLIAIAHADPVTAFHYTSGSVSGGKDPAAAYGFNLADVNSVAQLNYLPPGTKGLVWLGLCNGADSNFISTVTPYIGNPNLYGFYLVDEPDPTGRYHPLCSSVNLQAESDWIHARVPGVRTFIVLMNMRSDLSPAYENTYNYANTHIDLFGIDAYPCQTQFNGCNFGIISAAVAAAEAWGIAQGQIVPVYQAFGGGGPAYANYLVPTASQEKQIISAWGSLTPTPAFDFAYSWGSQGGDTSLSSSPELRQVFATHNQLGVMTSRP